MSVPSTRPVRGCVPHPHPLLHRGGIKQSHTVCVLRIMADDEAISFSLAELGDYYKANNKMVDDLVPKVIGSFAQIEKQFYTDLKEWFNSAANIESKVQSATQLVKYIISFVLLAKENGKSWSPPSVFGIIVPQMVLQHKGPDGIPPNDDNNDKGGEDDTDTCAPMSAREFSTIMAKLEERITKNIAKSLSPSTQLNRRQQQSAMSRILAEEISGDDEGGAGLPHSHAAPRDDDVDVDDPDILYFPLQWLDKAQVSTAEMRQLMMTLREATRIKNPKHKSEQYQVDHLLQVAHLIFKGKQEEACELIAYRIHFLLKSTTRHLGEAIDYYEHLVKAKRPQKEREADIMSKIPKNMPSKQAAFLGQQLTGKGNKDQMGQGGAGAGHSGAGAGTQGAGEVQRGRRGRRQF